MKKYKKSTYKFLAMFGNNVEFAKSEIDRLIQYYEIKGDKEKLEELFSIKDELYETI